jgi:hypothetical protein
VLAQHAELKEAQMAEMVTCPGCSSSNVCLVNRKDNFRPRSGTGNLKADLTPISTTVNYKCQDPNCGREWSETISTRDQTESQGSG